MDFITIKNKVYAKTVTWDLAGVEMSDQEAVQKYLDDGYEPFGAVPHIKRDNKAMLANPQSGGVITDNLIFMRKGNVSLVEVEPKKTNKKDTKEVKEAQDESNT